MNKNRFMVLKNSLSNFLTNKKCPLVFTGLALLLVIGSVFTNLQFDDYLHRSKILNPEELGGDQNPIMGLFAFSMGDVEDNQERIEHSYVPWWTTSEYKIAFFRPLAAITHWLDYQLWPDIPALMHVHSMLWFGAMILAASLVYRRMIVSQWTAGLAVLLFAIDGAHGIPAGWLANRNALIAAVFGFLAVYFHDRWRRDGLRGRALLATVFFLLSLFSGEAGLAAGAYLLSYELFLFSGSWRKKAAGMLPYIISAAIWWIIYHHLGYGTYGSGSYVDPAQTPIAFLKLLVERMPLLLFGQWLVLDPLFYGYWTKPFVYWGLAGIYALLACIGVLLLPLVKRNAVARFWLLGMVLSLLPICATFPAERLLIFVGFGGMGLLAQFLASWFEKPLWLPTSRSWHILAKTFVIIFVWTHLIVSPMMLPITSVSMKIYDEVAIEKPLLNLSQSTDFSDKTLVFINPAESFSVSFIPFFCDNHELSPPAQTHILVSGLTPRITIKRIDDATIEMEPENGFITSDLDRLFRGSTHPMHIGQKIKAGDMRVKVLTLTDDNRPLRVRFSFSHPLEDNSMAFYAWEGDGFVPFKLPKKGQMTSLERKRYMPDIFTKKSDEKSRYQAQF